MTRRVIEGCWRFHMLVTYRPIGTMDGDVMICTCTPLPFFIGWINRYDDYLYDIFLSVVEGGSIYEGFDSLYIKASENTDRDSRCVRAINVSFLNTLLYNSQTLGRIYSSMTIDKNACGCTLTLPCSISLKPCFLKIKTHLVLRF